MNFNFNQILANYEEFGPPTQLYITDEQVVSQHEIAVVMNIVNYVGSC